MANDITSINQNVISYFTNVKYLDIIGWFIFAVITICGFFYIYYYYKNKKIFNKIIEVNEVVGTYYFPSYNDLAKTVKIGSGGFEILYLKKLKTWKIAFGGRVGRNKYSFYVMPDGYWYSGLQSANLLTMDKEKGMVPVITTNPSMRTQYTSLEKQINDVHQDKRTFMDKYGIWIFSLGFLFVAGIMLYLNYQQFVKVSANLSGAIDKMIAFNQQSGSSGGVVIK